MYSLETVGIAALLSRLGSVFVIVLHGGSVSFLAVIARSPMTTFGRLLPPDG
jgi:hypothetical protein